jgi:hypothetical protein
MKLWVLYDVECDGHIVGIDAVTTDDGTAEIWRAESHFYRTGQFDTDEAADCVSDLFALNFEPSPNNSGQEGKHDAA